MEVRRAQPAASAPATGQEWLLHPSGQDATASDLNNLPSPPSVPTPTLTSHPVFM